MNMGPDEQAKQGDIELSSEKKSSKKLLKSFLRGVIRTNTDKIYKKKGDTEKKIKSLWDNLKRQMIQEKKPKVRMGSTTRRHLKDFINELKFKKEIMKTLSVSEEIDTGSSKFPESNNHLSQFPQEVSDIDTTPDDTTPSKINISEEEQKKLKKFKEME